MKAEKKKVEKKKYSAPIKLKLLITIVERSKADYYVDFLQDFEVNMQMITYGSGTANSEMLTYLGLPDTQKAVIFSIVKEEKMSKIKEKLQEKFKKIRNGKGIAYTISLSSVIGVAIYQFMCNNKMKKEEN
ncbi:MAG: hypothetical protein J1F31_05400 [Erysipelotrichales bacterium]|nr:hypothetical protein [Erysipelotrichales bacterium]